MTNTNVATVNPVVIPEKFMKQDTWYLTYEQDALIKALAKREDISRHEMLRQILDFAIQDYMDEFIKYEEQEELMKSAKHVGESKAEVDFLELTPPQRERAIRKAFQD